MQCHAVQRRATRLAKKIDVQVLLRLVAIAVLAKLVCTAINNLSPNRTAIAIVIAAYLITATRAALIAQLALVLAVCYATSVAASLVALAGAAV